jgi:menaquinone-specific isochorismate synthase
LKLALSTQEIATSDFSLIDHLPESPLAFIRAGGGIVGFGEVVKLTSKAGANRFADLAGQWQTLVANSDIHDDLKLPGTGLVAFGTFAFSDLSEAESVLIVPRVILGERDGRVWLTTVSVVGENAPDIADFWSKPGVYFENPAVELIAGEVTPNDFKHLVRAANAGIASGDFEKAVVARDLIAKAPTYFDLRTVLKRMAEAYPTCWIYSVDGMFGASPELLVRVSHGQVSARVLAGTAGRGTDPQVDQAISTALAASEKNTAEHAFAVNSLVKALTPFCKNVDADEKPFSLALPNLWHLASDVHGVLNENSSVLDLAAALHPTAAVAGTPTKAALSFIQEFEETDRGRYAGPVGWIGADGDGEWAIALRGAQLAEGNIRAFAGCGIVAGSDELAELAETDLKFRPIREALS